MKPERRIPAPIGGAIPVIAETALRGLGLPEFRVVVILGSMANLRRYRAPDRV